MRQNVFAAALLLIVGGVVYGQPAPELEKLKALVGTWDCTMTMMGQEIKGGTATYKLELGGQWLVSDFEINFGGMKFQGKGLDSYDVHKKQYVSVWFDSMTGTPMVSTGNFDKDGKSMTLNGEGVGPDGKSEKMKMVSTWKDKDTMTFTMYKVAGGKDAEQMSILYKRKK